MKKKNSKVHWVLDAEDLVLLRGCKKCKSEPAVFLTAKKVPCCKLHWEKLADGIEIMSIELEITKVDEAV